MIKEKKHRTQIDPAEAQLSSHTLSNIREKKGYAGAENDLHGKDGHVYPPSPSCPPPPPPHAGQIGSKTPAVVERRKEVAPGRAASVRARKGPIRKTVVVMMMIPAPGHNSGERTEQDDVVVPGGQERTQVLCP